MFLQLLTDFDSLFGEVHLVRKADEHSAFGREEGTCGFLALVVSEGVVVGEAEDFDYDDRSAHASLSPKGRHAHISTKVLSGQRSPSTTRYDESPTAHRRVTDLGNQRHRAGKFFLGRFRTYMRGRAIFDAYGVRRIASAMKTSLLVFAAFGSHAIYGLRGSLRSRPTS